LDKVFSYTLRQNEVSSADIHGIPQLDHSCQGVLSLLLGGVIYI
jgi:hypothetical protein